MLTNVISEEKGTFGCRHDAILVTRTDVADVFDIGHVVTVEIVHTLVLAELFLIELQVVG